MKADKNERLIKQRKQQQWKLHQQLASFMGDLDRLPDAQEARLNRQKSAPQYLLPMVF
jgi:hypothetical protein